MTILCLLRSAYISAMVASNLVAIAHKATGEHTTTAEMTNVIEPVGGHNLPSKGGVGSCARWSVDNRYRPETKYPSGANGQVGGHKHKSDPRTANLGRGQALRQSRDMGPELPGDPRPLSGSYAYRSPRSRGVADLSSSSTAEPVALRPASGDGRCDGDSRSTREGTNLKGGCNGK